MKRVLRMIRSVRIRWLWLGAALLAGLVLHIATVLSVTWTMPHRGMLALAGLGATNSMAVLPPVTPAGSPLPFMQADSRYAICHYDIRKGPVAIHASLGDDNWTLALYSPAGDNVYVVSGADLERREIELLLTATQDGQPTNLPISRDAAETTVTVGLGNSTGLAILTAPLANSAYGNLTDRLLAQSTCTQRGRTTAAN